MMKHLFLLLLPLFVIPCCSLWCFSCHSTNTDGCGDDFYISTSDFNHRTRCDTGSCVKMRGKRSHGEHVERTEIYRACIERRSEGCQDEEKFGMTMLACSCNSDFCNGGMIVSGNCGTVVGLSALVTFWLYSSLRNLL